ncbi:hypothetical protein IKQ19_15430 [Candidatus Saccharibacteria bacterium]|nr:hypothetical protein [Candidatus Saccharibacteria bacterium]
MKTRKSLLAIAAVSAVCLAFYGCDGSAPSGADGTESAFGGSSSSAGIGNGSGKISSSGKTSNSGSKSGSVVSCYVELPGGDGSASCSEVPTSYKTIDLFKETCQAQNVEGFAKATVGTGCPSGGKKCDQGGGIVAYYYGPAAEVNSCLDEYDDDDYGYGDDGGSSSYDGGTYYDGDYTVPDDYYGSPQIQSGSDATISGSVYSCEATSSGHSYCGEISQSSSGVNDFMIGCNEEGGTLGTGCPTSSKKCLFDELLLYFYDSVDKAKSCEQLYEEEW